MAVVEKNERHGRAVYSQVPGPIPTVDTSRFFGYLVPSGIVRHALWNQQYCSVSATRTLSLQGQLFPADCSGGDF